MRRMIIAFALLLLGFAPVLTPSYTFAASNDQIFSSCSQAPSSPVCKDKNTTTNPVNHIIKVAVSIVALMTGIAAVIMIIIGGLTMVTSSGNSEAVANSRKRIIYALIGLVIVALAWTLITFLTDKLIKT